MKMFILKLVSIVSIVFLKINSSLFLLQINNSPVSFCIHERKEIIYI